MEFYVDENNISEFPILPGETSFIVLGENADDKGLVNIGMGVRVFGSLEPELIEKAFQYIIDYNDIMRNIIINDNGRRYHKFLLDYKYKLDYEEYTSGTTEENFKAVYKDAYKITQTHIDIYDNILWKFKMYKVADDEYFLYLVMHHTITDGFAMLLIIKMLSSYYMTLKDGGVPENNEAGSFVEYIKSENMFAASEEGKKQTEYWKKQSEEYIPPDTSPAKSNEYVDLSARPLIFDKKEMELFAKKYKMSHFSFMLLAFHIAIGRFFNTDDTLVSIAAANRNDRKFTKTLGKLSRSLGNRLTIGENDVLSTLVKTVNNIVFENMKNQRAGGAYGNIKFNISYATDMGKKEKSTFAGYDVQPVDFPTPRDNINFMQMLVYDRAPILMILFVANSTEFGKNFIDKCKMCMKQVLFQLFYSPEIRPDELLVSPMLDKNEYSVSGSTLEMGADLLTADDNFLSLMNSGRLKLYFVNNGVKSETESEISIISDKNGLRLKIDNADSLEAGFYHIVLEAENREYLFDSFTIK